MKITLLCNCGLAIESGGRMLVIDALTEELPPFYRAPEPVRQDIINGRGDYNAVCGLLFTHLHPDHFDREAAQVFAVRHEDAIVYIPNRRTQVPEHLDAGPFSVELHRVRHTPVPGYGRSTVDTMIVSCEGKRVYIASDAAPETALHETVLAGRKMDAAFWNGEILLYKSERESLSRFAVRNFIYHIPAEEKDGLRRKLERLRARYPEECASVALLSAYPSEVIL